MIARRGLSMVLCVLMVATVFPMMLSSPASGEGMDVEGIPAEMVSYWKFDDGEGTEATDSAHDNPGTLKGDPVWSDGVVNGALQLDGSGDHVEVQDSPGLDITDGITMEAWIKPAVTSGRYIIHKGWNQGTTGNGGVYSFDIYPGKLRTVLVTGTGDAHMVTGSTPIAQNTWQHLAVTWDGTTIRLYHNGQPDGTGIFTGQIGNTDAEVLIGRYGEWYFTGDLDEVAIYNAALTSDEIGQHYADGLAGEGYYYTDPGPMPHGMGGALVFDGEDDSVIVPDSDSLDITGGLTVEFWMEQDTPGPETPPMSHWTAISNVVELQNMKENLYGQYYLTNDIDCSSTRYWNDGAGFEPIGSVSSSYRFGGSFDGRGFTISNLYINRPDSSLTGLFSEASGQLFNVRLDDVEIHGKNYVGGLVGMASGRLSNVRLDDAEIHGKNYVGGLVGKSDTVHIENVCVSGTVTGEDHVGGLAGAHCGYDISLSQFKIKNSHSSATVTGHDKVGGLVGYLFDHGSLSKTFSTGSARGDSSVGGLVGYNSQSGFIYDSYSTARVDGSLHVGGLVGLNDGDVVRVYSAGPVTGESSVGGLVGTNFQGSTLYSRWDKEASGQSSSAGGTGKTTTQMMQESTFSQWSFSIVWWMDEGLDYPRLRWERESRDTVVTKGKDAFSIQVERDGSAVYSYVGGQLATAHQDDPGRWHHCAITFDGTTQRLYVDGTLRAMGDVAGGMGVNTKDLVIGGGDVGFFKGTLDEMRLWSAPLDIDTIGNWMYREVDPTHPAYDDLVYCYRLNQVEGLAAKDTIGGNDGTLTNMDEASWVDSTVARTWTTGINTLLKGSLTGSYADGSSSDGADWALTFQVVDPGTKGTAAITTGNHFQYTPGPDEEGMDTFTYTVASGYRVSDELSVQVSIADRAPVAGFDMALRLDGGEDLVTIPDSDGLDVPDAFTVEAWTKHAPMRVEPSTVPVGTPVSTVQDLQDMQLDPMGDYYLTNDIDCSATVNWDGGKGFDPVGHMYIPFTGSLDGRGYSITNLNINRPNEEDVGLFGWAVSAEINDLGMEDLDVHGGDSVGGLVGHLSSGTVSNVRSTGSVEGDSSVGGLVGGLSNSEFDASHSSTHVTGGNWVGGLVGTNSGSTIAASYFTGSVEGSSSVGGLVGRNDNSAAISNSFSKGQVSGNGFLGGLVGINADAASISDSYANGPVSGLQYVGGLVGKNEDEATISNSYSAGAVSGSMHPGGLVSIDDTGGPIESSYYDSETTGQSDTGKGEPRTAAEMMQQATFEGWDFQTGWAIDENANAPYFPWQRENLLYKGGGTYSLQMEMDGSALHARAGGSVISAQLPVPGAWHHSALTFDGSQLGLFIDGALHSTVLCQDYDVNSHDLLIGGGWGPDYRGLVDELRIWDTPLTQSTIDDWMYREADHTHPEQDHLVSYYGFDGGSDMAISDRVGSNHGILTGDPDGVRVHSTVGLEWWAVMNVEFDGKLAGGDRDGSSTDGSDWAVSFEILQQPAKGVLNPGIDNEVNYVPNINEMGYDSFIYRTSSGGLYSQDMVVSLLIQTGNSIPVAQLNDHHEVEEGALLAFNAGNSHDADLDPLLYRWDFDGDGNWDTEYSDSHIGLHTWYDDYEGTVYLEVFDGQATDVAETTVHVYNAAPVINIDIVRMSRNYQRPSTVLDFKGSIDDPGGDDTHSITWTLNPGSLQVDHLLEFSIILVADTYNVNLQVTDDDGAWAIKFCTIYWTMLNINDDGIVESVSMNVDKNGDNQWEYRYLYSDMLGPDNPGVPGGDGRPEHVLEYEDQDGDGNPEYHYEYWDGDSDGIPSSETLDIWGNFIVEEDYWISADETTIHGGIHVKSGSTLEVLNSQLTCDAVIIEDGAILKLLDSELDCADIIIEEGGTLNTDPTQITMDGNLIVDGTVILDDTVLTMNCAQDGEHGIRVGPTGTMEIVQGSTVTSGDPEFEYWFEVEDGATFKMEDSELHECGWDDDNPGLTIYTDDIIIDGNLISNNHHGIHIESSSGGVVRNNMLSDNGLGIYCSGGLDILFYHNNFVSNGIHAWDDSDNSWNGALPDGGNHWDTWMSPDANGDTYVDEPYPIPGGSNVDQYPFVKVDDWLNSAPTAPIASIIPEDPYMLDDLKCQVVTPSADADGDVITYTYEWYRDLGEGFVLQPGLTTVTMELSASVATEYTLAGESWKCVVTPDDGIEDGPTAQDEVTILFARETKMAMLASLQDLQPLDDVKLDKKLGKAIKALADSLNEAHWDNGNHLDAKDGKKVFDNGKKCVKELMKIVKDKGCPQELKDDCLAVIETLVTIDELLARIALDDAEQYSGIEKVDKELDKCEKEFTKAQKELDHTKKDGTPDPKYDKAIDHCKHAWEHAQRAIKHGV